MTRRPACPESKELETRFPKNRREAWRATYAFEVKKTRFSFYKTMPEYELYNESGRPDENFPTVTAILLTPATLTV